MSKDEIEQGEANSDSQSLMWRDMKVSHSDIEEREERTSLQM